MCRVVDVLRTTVCQVNGHLGGVALQLKRKTDAKFAAQYKINRKYIHVVVLVLAAVFAVVSLRSVMRCLACACVSLFPLLSAV